MNQLINDIFCHWKWTCMMHDLPTEADIFPAYCVFSHSSTALPVTFTYSAPCSRYSFVVFHHEICFILNNLVQKGWHLENLLYENRRFNLWDITSGSSVCYCHFVSDSQHKTSDNTQMWLELCLNNHELRLKLLLLGMGHIGLIISEIYNSIKCNENYYINF